MEDIARQAVVMKTGPLCQARICKAEGIEFTVNVLQSDEILPVIRDHFRLAVNNKGVLINWLKSGPTKCSLLEIAQVGVKVVDEKWRKRVIQLYENEPDTPHCRDTGNSIEFLYL